MIEVQLAPETAKSWKEKRKKRACCPVERFNVPDRSRFGVLKEVGGFCQQQRCKPLKTGRFPAGLRLVSDQIHATHFNLIYEFVTETDRKPNPL